MIEIKKLVEEIATNKRQVFTDSRKKFAAADVFIALIGESHDASQFVEQLISQGLDIAVVTDSQTNRDKLSGNNVIFVSDTTKFLQEVAAKRLEYWRQLDVNNKVIALTGSNGKTTTKEMLAWLLSGEKYKVHVTKGNLNNHFGVPYTILEMPLETDIVILEMGTNHPGEIELLCEIAPCDAGFITNIGQSHLEFFHNEGNVMVEKSALYRKIVSRNKGLFIVNGLDSRLANLSGEKFTKTLSAEGDIKLQMSSTRIQIEAEQFQIDIDCKNIPEKHNRLNMALALSLCASLYPDDKFIEHLKKRAQSFKQPRNNRSMLLKNDQSTIYLDAYNANPSSMKTSIEGFVDWWRSENDQNLDGIWFILGDMNELGDRAPEYHEQIGRYLKQIGASKVTFIGRYAADYQKGYGSTESFKDRHGFLTQYGQGPSGWNKQVAFIKGSRTLQLEELIDITVFPVL